MTCCAAIPSKLSPRLLPILLVLLCPVLPSPAESPFLVDAALGFDGYFKRGAWCPLQVTVENLGVSFLGEIQVVVGKAGQPDPGQTIYARSIDLPRSARKRYEFVIRLNDEYRSVRVRIIGGRRILEQIEIDIVGRGLSETVILGLGRAVSLDFLNRFSRDIRIIYPHLNGLPERWYGYDGVSAVVLHDAPLAEMTADQVTALDDWVASGGNLVVSGGVHLSQREGAVLDRLLPVEPAGSTRISGFTSLIERFGGNPEENRPLTATDSAAPGSGVLAEEDGVPLVVSRRSGRGSVTFLAFDFARPPIFGWSGRDALWRFLLFREDRPAAASSAVDSGSIDLGDRMIRAIRDGTEVRFPSRLYFLLFLLPLLGAPIFLLFIGRGRNLRANVRRYIVLLAAAAGASSAGLLLSSGGPASAVDLSIIEAGADRGLLDRTFWLVSSGKRRYTIEAAYAPLRVESFGGGSLVIREGAETAVEGLEIGRWQDRRLRIGTMVPLSVEGDIRRVGARLEVQVANTSGRELKRCLLFHRGGGFTVGDMEPGERRIERFVQDTTPKSGIPEEADGKDTLRRAILDAVREISASSSRRTVIFTGWLEEPVFPLTVEGGRPRQLTLIILRLEAEG